MIQFLFVCNLFTQNESGKMSQALATIENYSVFVDLIFLLLQILFKVKLGRVGICYRIVCYRRTISNGVIIATRRHSAYRNKNSPFILSRSSHTDCIVIWVVIWKYFPSIFMFAFWESYLQFFSYFILNGELVLAYST